MTDIEQRLKRLEEENTVNKLDISSLIKDNKYLKNIIAAIRAGNESLIAEIADQVETFQLSVILLKQKNALLRQSNSVLRNRLTSLSEVQESPENRIAELENQNKVQAENVAHLEAMVEEFQSIFDSCDITGKK